MLALDVARELIAVREALHNQDSIVLNRDNPEHHCHFFANGDRWTSAYLRPSTFADRDDPVLFRVETHADLAHWLGICDRCGEVALPVQPPVQTLPLIVPLGSVGQAPRYQVRHLAVGQFHL